MNIVNKKYKIKKKKILAKVKLSCEKYEPLKEFTDFFLTTSKKIGIKYIGPSSLPKKKIVFKVRKSPGGSGKASYERYKYEVHTKIYNVYEKRLFNFITKYLSTKKEFITKINLY